MLPHLLEDRLTDGGEVRLTRRLAFNLMNIPRTHFC
jgi:hypothetical protein